MEQSPLSGYVKAAAFGILALVVFLAFWQRTSVEDKLVALDRTVADLGDKVGEMRSDLAATNRESAKLRGANETLLKLLARGGVRVQQPAEGGTKQPSVDLGMDDKPTDWGWDRNAAIDKALDPGRPLGTPGRYKNLLRLDPAGPEAPLDAPNLKGEIRLPWGPEPKGFNPLIENYATLSNELLTYVLDTPAQRHWKVPSSFNWKPALCWRVEVSPDYKEYTLFFRRDAFWQKPAVDLRKYPHLAGRHRLTAHDAAFTFAIIQDKQSDCAVARSYLDELESVKAIDDFTLVVRWKKTLFISLAQTMEATILPEFVYGFDPEGRRYPKETVAQEFNNHWFDRLRAGLVGSGPYRFVKYEPGKYVRMERWEDWYGFKDEPVFPIRVRHLRIYNEPETMMNWLHTGELDIGWFNASRYRTWVLDETDPKSPVLRGDLKIYKAPTPVYYYVGWKNSDPMFSDKRVRQALTYAFNRFEICDKIFLGQRIPMAAPLYPASKEADPDLKPYPFDMAKAKRLLDEAGWQMNPDTGLRERTVKGQTLVMDFKLYYPGPNAEYQNAFDYYKNDLLKIGIRMLPQSVQWAQFQKDLGDRKYKAFSLGWALNGWEHDFGQIWHSRGIQDPQSSNYIEFNNPEVDRLSDALRRIMDPEKRIAAVRRIGRILYEEQPYTFFAWRTDFRGYWKWVHNVEEKPYFIRPFLRTFPFWIER